MTTPLLEATGLTVRRNGRTLLQDVDLTVRAGEKLAVIGPNGAGKTTLLRCLTGTWSPDAGSVRWDGQPLSTHSPRDLARSRAVVAQRAHLDFDFAVHEVVAMGLAPHGRVSQARHRVRTSLSEVGALDLHDRRWTRLSGGEQQRVALARSLAQLRAGSADRTRVLLLDEPTNHLDPAWQLQALSVAASLATEGIGVLAILHDLALASSWADHIVVLDQGRRVASGPPIDVLTPDLLARVFRLEAAVVPHPHHGRPWIVPVHPLIAPTRSPNVHAATP